MCTESRRNSNETDKRIADFLHELGMLKKIERTGYPFLGSGGESVADHSFRVAVIGHILSCLCGYEDPLRVVLMCLLHDVAEARTGDQNYVHKQYVSVDSDKAFRDATEGLPCSKLYREIWQEYCEGETLAAQIVSDADQLDLLVELKKEKDLRNPYADRWIEHLLKRLYTDEAKRLAKAILETDWTSWWFDGHDSWWQKR